MLKSICKKIHSIFTKVMSEGVTPVKMAQSSACGFYIAFSPFPGLHTVMILATSWLFKLNFPIVFVAASINNPWTMIPLYSLDYVFGYWFLHKLLGWGDLWLIPLDRIFGSGFICIWSFMIGGNILGIIAALVSYPILKKIFVRIMSNRGLVN